MYIIMRVILKASVRVCVCDVYTNVTPLRICKLIVNTYENPSDLRFS
jgi:hypothetical protein